MTRFFSQVILEDGRAGDARRPSCRGAGGPGRGVKRARRCSLLAVLAAGCGHDEHASHHRRRRPPVTSRTAAASPSPRAVLVTVIDGNTEARVHGARRQGRRPLGAHGRAAASRASRSATTPRSSPTCARGGYLAKLAAPLRSGRVRSRRSASTGRRSSGRCTASTRAARRRRRRSACDRRSAIDLVARHRLADRVPRGRLGGRRVRRQLPRHGRRRSRWTTATSLWRRRTPQREDGVVARGLGRPARRPRDGRASSASSPRANGRAALALRRRLAGRVVADRARRRRLLRHLERPRLRARPAPHALALDVPLGLQDHLVRGDRRRHALHRRLLRPAARARARDRPRALGGAVNGRIYGTPAVAAGRVFVPSSSGGSLSAFSTSGRLPLASLRSARTSTRRRRSGAAASSSAPTAASSTPLSAASGRTLWTGRRGRPDLGRRRRRRRRRLRGLVRAPHRRRRRRERPRRCSTSRTASTSRSRVTAADCCCTATRGSTLSPLDEDVAARRRGRGRARAARRSAPPTYLHVKHAGARHPRLLDGRVRADAPPPPPKPKEPGVAWPMYGHDAAAAARRDRHLARAAVPARLDVPRAEPRRVPARRRLRAALLRQQRRRPLRDQREDGQARLAVRLEALPGDVACGRRPHRLRDLPQPAAVQRHGRQQGELVAFWAGSGQGALAQDDRAFGVVTARPRGRRLRRRLERRRLCVLGGHRPALVDVPGRRAR